MKKITTAVFMAISLASVSAFAAPNFEQQASTLASETIKYQRQASLAKQQSMDACRQSHDALHNVIKDLNADEKKAFMKEYRYQMRQQVAKLGRDEVYDEFVCGMKKPPKDKQAKNKKKKTKKSTQAKESVLKPVE